MALYELLSPLENPLPWAFNVSSLGGKGYNLSRIARGFPKGVVPCGVVVPTNVYQEHVNSMPRIKRMGEEFYRDFNAQLKGGGRRANQLPSFRRMEEIREAILAQPLKARVCNEISAFLETNRLESGSFSVRSSATTEDGEASSFAGVFDTFLNQRGASDVQGAIKKCWASMWSSSVYEYLKALSLRDSVHENPGVIQPVMAVVLQAQVLSKAAGVMFTMNTRNGALSEFVVESVFGQGEGLVSGSLKPDKFLLRNPNLEERGGQGCSTDEQGQPPDSNFLILQANISFKTHRFVTATNGNGWKREVVPGHLQNVSSLTAVQLKQLAAYGARIKDAIYCGVPQDIEFAVDPLTDQVLLLQTRPVTSIAPNANAVVAKPFQLPAFLSKKRAQYLWKINEHFVKPQTPLWTTHYLKGLKRAVGENFKSYTGLSSLVDFVNVNGFVYTRADIKESAPGRGPALSIKWAIAALVDAVPDVIVRALTRVLFRVVPPLQKIGEHAKSVFVEKLWLKDLKFWDEVRRPELVSAHTSLTSTGLEKLSDSELFEHIYALLEHYEFCAYNHHLFNFATMLPSSLFMMFSRQCGLNEAEILGLLEGKLKEQVYRHGPGDQLRSAFRGSTALESLKCAAAAASDEDAWVLLRALRTRNDDVGSAMNFYLRDNEFRQVGGYDTTYKSGHEMPRILASAAIKIIEDDLVFLNETYEENLANAREKIARLNGVPMLHAWEDKLNDAQACHRLRDERSLYSDIWGAGILRHALLHLGQRAFMGGAFARESKREAILFITLEELKQLHRFVANEHRSDNIMPVVDALSNVLSHRHQYHKETDIMAAPKVLNGPGKEGDSFQAKLIAKIGDPYVYDLLMGLYTSNKQVSGDVAHEKSGSGWNASSGIIQGDPASSGTYRGTVKLIRSPADFGKVREGSVVVAQFTNSSFTLLMSKAGAVVTEVGGTLSHAAIVCRESKVPCVTNVGSVMKTILNDGDLVEVNGGKGIVRKLEREQRAKL